MRCIVGLGNPGKSYEFTRHNVGFLMIEALRKLWGFPEWKDSSFHGVISEGIFQGKKIILLKPMTFMNLSGDAVHPLIQFYKLDVSKDILVISDDLDMEFAKVRYRLQGSHGGQNGLKDIVTKLGTQNISRIKIGIGRDERYAVSDWVLSRFQKGEREILDTDIFPQVEEYIDKWILGD